MKRVRIQDSESKGQWITATELGMGKDWSPDQAFRRLYYDGKITRKF